MAELKTAIVPLNGKNYPTWKVQCRMALVKDSLWGIVSGKEAAPTLEGDAQTSALAKYLARRDRALAIIVLAVDPSLLYLLGDPVDPQVVWKKLEEQFQRKTWANKLHLRRKLFGLKLKEGGSVSNHIKTLTEIFEALAVIDDAVTEDDRVVHLLASLPDSYNVLVTALEAQSENVPKWELVTERLLHEESKLQEKAPSRDSDGRKALTVSSQRNPKGSKSYKCHFCHKPGHFKKDCRKYLAQQKQAANPAVTKTESDGEALVATHALTATSKGSWIIDSGATCHMCNDETAFDELRPLETPLQVTLGDGRSLKATAEGIVRIEALMPNGSTQKCTLRNVLLIPELSYSLLSVPKTSEIGNSIKFTKSGCEIFNNEKKMIAFATKAGNLFYLEHCRKTQNLNVVEECKERLWHRRYGHISENSLRNIAKHNLAEKFDFGHSGKVGLCESCIGGKQHRTPFDSSSRQTSDLLELVHSDVCGKISGKSIGGAQYFLTLTDDKSR